MIQLRPYQQEAVNSVYQYFMERDGNPLIVLPTGTGKSLVLGDFVKGAIERYPRTRVLMLTHVKELIAQNFAELISLWREAPAGIFSAGVGRRDMYAQVLYAGIQSIARHIDKFAPFDLVLIDEAQLIPRNSNTMYRKVLDALKRKNPRIKVIGLTATPFRMDSGMLHTGDNAIFSDICYEYSIVQAIKDGYLCPPTAKQTETGLAVDGVHRRGGEFMPGELEAAVNVDEITRAAVAEIVERGRDRGSWLTFCAGVKHANAVAEVIRSYGISCATVLGDTPAAERNLMIRDFKAGHIRCLTNAQVLTTGFNAPRISLISDLAPTESVGLHVQKIGRGTRIFPGKEDCLVLDFARNVSRHGPLDNLNIKEPGKGGGEAPIKICDECDEILHAAARVCTNCGFVFPEPELKITRTAGDDAVLSSQIVSTWRDVQFVNYMLHPGRNGKKPTMRVDYVCTNRQKPYSEWVCFEHTGYPRTKAQIWWSARFPGEIAPSDVKEAIALIRLYAPSPTKIETKPEGQYTTILETEFEPRNS